MPVAVPDYFTLQRAEVRRILHALGNNVGILNSNVRYLADCSLRGMNSDQVLALRDAATSSEQTASLLRELQRVLG